MFSPQVTSLSSLKITQTDPAPAQISPGAARTSETACQEQQSVPPRRGATPGKRDRLLRSFPSSHPQPNAPRSSASAAIFPPRVPGDARRELGSESPTGHPNSSPVPPTPAETPAVGKEKHLLSSWFPQPQNASSPPRLGSQQPCSCSNAGAERSAIPARHVNHDRTPSAASAEAICSESGSAGGTGIPAEVEGGGEPTSSGRHAGCGGELCLPSATGATRSSGKHVKSSPQHLGSLAKVSRGWVTHPGETLA